LRRYLDELGIDVVTDASIAAVVGDRRVEQVELTSGKALPADICVTCAGIRPNIEVAAAAGLTTNRGVVVSETMRTNDPKIFAVGDVAEVPGAPGGLWAVGTAHAAVAADAIFGGDKAFELPISLVSLKLDGIDVKGFGARDAGDGIEEIFDPDEPDNVHRRQFVEGGRFVGAVVVGPPGTGKDVAKAIQNRVDISGAMDRLRAFDWSALGDLPQELSGDHPLRKAA
jgi:nitrite reductase (NADH) large subunit